MASEPQNTLTFAVEEMGETIEPAGKGVAQKYAIELPKMSYGSIHLEFKRCGKPHCRCSRGLLHGPYFYRHWRQHQRQHKSYVPITNLAETLQALARERAERPNAALVKKILREVADGL